MFDMVCRMKLGTWFLLIFYSCSINGPFLANARMETAESCRLTEQVFQQTLKQILVIFVVELYWSKSLSHSWCCLCRIYLLRAVQMVWMVCVRGFVLTVKFVLFGCWIEANNRKLETIYSVLFLFLFIFSKKTAFWLCGRVLKKWQAIS